MVWDEYGILVIPPYATLVQHLATSDNIIRGLMQNSTRSGDDPISACSQFIHGDSMALVLHRGMVVMDDQICDVAISW